MLALTIPIGLLIGLTMGALGGGGAIIAVPVLVYLLGQDAREATTGSLIVVEVTALIGMWPHHRAGRARIGQGLVFGVLGGLAAYLGSRLAVGVPDAALLTAFAALLLLVAGAMTWWQRRSASEPLAVERPVVARRPRLTVDWPRVALLVLTASVVGLLTGFFGVGGGFAIVPALVLVLGLPMRVAVGTSLVVIAVTSTSALASRLGDGVSVDWPVIGVFAVAAVVGSLLGSRVTSRVSPERLNLAFTVLLVVVAAAMAVRSVPLL